MEQTGLLQQASGIEAVAWGLHDGGVEFVTAYPGFHAHDLADHLDIPTFSINEKNALAVAWGASLAGLRATAIFKNVGLNDAADPFVNACVLGVRAGLVLVVLDDIDVEQSQIQQDSRPYAEFPCSLWLEPRSVADAYDLARQAAELSEHLETLVVLRLTNLLTQASGPVRRFPVLTGRMDFRRDPQRWVAHPAHGEIQRQRLLARQEAVAAWVDAACPVPTLPADRPVLMTAGMASLAGQPPDLITFTLPLPRPWLQALAYLNAPIIVEEHGGPYLAGKVAAALGATRVRPCPVRAPGSVREYRSTERYEPLYSLLREVPGRVVVGDLGGHTMDPAGTVDACLCYGCSVGVATGLALADSTARVFCVTGDAAFRHSGRLALEEAVARQASLVVIVLDNGGSVGTGGQRLPGTCWADVPGLERHDLGFPTEGAVEPLRNLLERPARPRLVRLGTTF
ncbi:MAG: thiamine pyrophosphate-dependent enzyme [Gemmataceae bacterium]